MDYYIPIDLILKLIGKLDLNKNDYICKKTTIYNNKM